MKRGNKGQSTIEFTVLVSFMILMFSIFFVLIGQKLVELRFERNTEIALALKSVVNTEFQLAKVAENGYFRQFKLPASIEGMNYDISITNSTELNIIVGQEEIHMRLPNNISGNISKGLNNITKENKIIIVMPAN